MNKHPSWFRRRFGDSKDFMWAILWAFLILIIGVLLGGLAVAFVAWVL